MCTEGEQIFGNNKWSKFLNDNINSRFAVLLDNIN